MVNGQCLMVNVQSFYYRQIRGLRGLRASKFPRALGKFYSLVRAHLFSFIDDAKVQHSRCGLRIICEEFLLFFCEVVIWSFVIWSKSKTDAVKTATII